MGHEETESGVRRMLAARRIAVVGLSDDPSRASFGVASYLISIGREVVPVNPNCRRVLGLDSYPSLLDVPGTIDLVDVFRRAEHCAGIAEDAITIGAKGLWLQLGVISEEARLLAKKAGIDFVQDRCLKIDLMTSG